jgi:GNAT superfamily N-acetyltransferase
MERMSAKSQIYLIHGVTGEFAEASLLEDISEELVAATDAVWRPYFQKAIADAVARGVNRANLPEHSHWEWLRKYRNRPEASRFFAIECDGQVEGLMAVRLDKLSRLPSQAELPLVYIDYLSTAPWNMVAFVSEPRYKGCGTALINVATQYSLAAGFSGRIGLHSLPQADSFYRGSFGLADMGIDEAYEELRYFERAGESL